MAELRMKEDLVVLDVMQVQNICVRRNLDSTGSKATVVDRLLQR